MFEKLLPFKPIHVQASTHARTYVCIVEVAIQMKMMSENDGRDDDELLCSICFPHNEQEYTYIEK